MSVHNEPSECSAWPWHLLLLGSAFCPRGTKITASECLERIIQVGGISNQAVLLNDPPRLADTDSTENALTFLSPRVISRRQ